jgi:uncharacterized membrane protein (UPF0127 family)
MKLTDIFSDGRKRNSIGAGVLVLLIAIALSVAGWNLFQVNTNKTDTELIKFPNIQLQTSAKITSPQGVDINVYIAGTEKQRTDGLSGFKTLPQDTGMLFVFPQVGIYKFWMKDMNFPLDIIWFDESMQIVDQVINVQPRDYPKTYIPQAAAKYVLEIPANTAELYGFSIGKKVFLTHNE